MLPNSMFVQFLSLNSKRHFNKLNIKTQYAKTIQIFLKKTTDVKVMNINKYNNHSEILLQKSHRNKKVFKPLPLKKYLF